MKSNIFKKKVYIGFLNEDFTVEFFNFIYFPQFAFLENILKLYVEKDE
jgi:hypothetical protein